MTHNDYQKENYNNNFAQFYNKYLTGQAKKYGSFISSFLKDQGIVTGKIIDIMCGTGNLLIQFEKNNWETYGLDISKDMLDIAQQNLPKTTLLQTDVTDFQIDTKFQVAVSTADAFNHLEKLSDIEKAFKNIYNLLVNSGYFIFDMNTPLGIKSNNFYISSSDEDGMSIREGFVDEIHKVGFTRFQGAFRLNKDSQYLRFDSTIYNYCHDIPEIKEKLLSIGFKTVDIMDDYSYDKWDPKHSKRVLFICRKY